MDADLTQRLDQQDQILVKIYASVEKTRKYFLWTLIITFVTMVLPLIGLAFMIPYLMNTLNSIYSGF